MNAESGLANCRYIAAGAPPADINAPEITQVLRITDSNARHRRLESILGTKLQFEPRRRGDIEFIFAPSQAATARLVRPQLRFHFAGDIPTYAISDAFEPDPMANEDMQGLMFPDMPWMLNDDGLTADVREAARAFSDPPSRRGRLFAFGYDAFRIATSLQRGQPVNPQGLTGTLSVDAQGRVRRELEWVRIKSGAPVPLDGADAPLPSPTN